MVELLRFYETEASVYLLLQHASGGKLWNYISGYLHQHNDTHLDDVLDDIHERNLRTHKPSVGSDASSKTVSSSTSTKTVTIKSTTEDGAVDIKSTTGTVMFSQHKDDISSDAQKIQDELYDRQESTTEVDSLLDDNQSIDQSGGKTDLGKSLSLEEKSRVHNTADNHDNQNFFDVLKAADTSVNAFSINSFDSDGGVGSRMNSTTSDYAIESIPEAQCEVSPSHTVPNRQSEGDVFNPTAGGGDLNGAKDDNAQKDVCDDNKGEDFDTFSTIKGAEAAIESANRLLNENLSESQRSATKPEEPNGLNFVLPEVPKDELKFSNEEVSIYDLHKPTESESESSSPERPVHLFLDKDGQPQVNSPKTSTPSGKSRHSSSTMSSPRDPERTPVIYRMPSQERSLESEVRPRKRNLSSVFRDLDLAEGDVKTRVHLPEACVCQWAAEITVAIGFLHSLGIVCK